MTSHYIIEPEVAGGWGDQTEFTRTPGRPVVVHKLHYEFDGWLGDELLESTPCFIVTERMAAALQHAQLTGFGLDSVVVSVSGQFEDLHPGRDLPKFVWLKVVGTAGNDDFGLTSNLLLVVSERALSVLKSVGIPNADVSPFAA